MSKEDRSYTPEVEAGISKAADVLAKLFAPDVPGAARGWAKNIAMFSESPLAVLETLDCGKDEHGVIIKLTASGKELALAFSGFGRVRIEYYDGNLLRRDTVTKWENVIYSGKIGELNFRSENGSSVGIRKAPGTIVIFSFLDVEY